MYLIVNILLLFIILIVLITVFIILLITIQDGGYIVNTVSGVFVTTNK